MTISDLGPTLYDQLLKKTRDITLLDTAEEIIHWDMETMMPPGAIALRSEQLGLISKIAHQMMTNQEIGQILDRLPHTPDYGRLSPLQQRNVYLIRKQYDEETKLPEDLVVETTKQQAISIDKWKRAKAAKRFSDFRPELEKMVDLRKKAAHILMEVKKTATPYDALIDIFEPHMTSKTISEIFSQLRIGLDKVISNCRSARQVPDTTILSRRVPIETQRVISRKISEIIGYDIRSAQAGGRIDETEHPFTTGYYSDVRITTHYYEDKWTSSIFSVLHEIGHAMYSQNVPADWMYQPIGDSCSLGIHESQSRFFENILGRSREFWVYFLPRLKQITGPVFADVDLDGIIHAINEVKTSKIRIESDEATYCLHIIIRYEIERDLFNEKIAVSELPEVWNEKYKQYLGVEVENDSEGVMQDTHWASGSFGYFPTYALGNIYGGQILERLQKDLPDWRQDLSRGECGEIKNWLIDHVYRYGNLLDPLELVKEISGKGITVEPYLSYLNDKFSQLYEYTQ